MRVARFAVLFLLVAFVASAPNAAAQTSAPTSAAAVADTLVAVDSAGVQSDPATSDSLAFYRAEVSRLDNEGDQQGTIRTLRQVVRLAPEDLDARRLLALYLGWDDRPSEARDHYEVIVASAPEDRASTLALASLLTWDGSAGRAVQLAQPFAARDSSDAEAQRVLALALAAAQQHREAERQFDLALELSPSDPVLLLEAGSHGRWHGDWAKGRERLERALALSLPSAEQARARQLIADIRETYAPRVRTSATYLRDSNGIARWTTPLVGSYVFGARWSAGLDVTREAIEDLQPPDSLGLASLQAEVLRVTPTVLYTPVRTLQIRASLGLDVLDLDRSEPRALLEARRTWSGDRYRSVAVRLRTGIGTEAVRAVGQGIRISAVEVEGYSELGGGRALGGQLALRSYSDGNTRVLTSLFGSQRLKTWRGRVSGSASLEGGLALDDTRIVYPTAQPYWTPSGLATGVARLAVSLQAPHGLGLGAAVGGSVQRDAFATSPSIDYRVAPTYTTGPHTLGVRVEQSGSAVYSARTVELIYSVRL